MDDAVRDRLIALIAEHGRSICTTPRVVSLLLQQACPNADEPIRELELALSNRCVAPMLETLPELADVEQLTQKLMAAAEIPEARARWAIETWVAALSEERSVSSHLARDWSQWNQLDVSEDMGGGLGPYRRSMIHLAIVAAAGAFGGTTLGWLSFLRGDLWSLEPWRDAVADLPEWARGISVMVLGALGGGAGGLLGWIFGGGRSWTYDAYGTTTLGRLWYSTSGAYFGSNLGVLCGLALMGPMGATLGGLVGASLGAFLGLMTAERISRFWWW